MNTSASDPDSGTKETGLPDREIELLDSNTVRRLLVDEAGIDWPDGTTVRDVRVERVWPTRDGRFMFEWSFRLVGHHRQPGRAARYELFAETGVSRTDAPEYRSATRPSRLAGEIRGVLIAVPHRNLLLFSPDRDPGMAHLARCLSGNEMAEPLRPHWEESNGEPPDKQVSRVTCRLLAYRARKRAAIAYKLALPDGRSCRLLGKTFCNDGHASGRAERLRRRHLTLDEKLAENTRGRVRATKPVGLLPDLRMLLFTWIGTTELPTSETGKQGVPVSDEDGLAPVAHDHLLAGVDALAALHRTPMNDLPVFSAEDECRVVKRWHGVLSRLAPQHAATTAPLVNSLLSGALSLNRAHACTVHRDFYERQFITYSDTTTLVDLDTLGHGDPAVDLGNYLTHIVLDGLQTRGATSDNPATAEMVVGRYLCSGVAVKRDALAFYWASSLFRVGAVHAVRSRTKEYSFFMWKLAADLLCYMGFGSVVSIPDKTEGSALPDARSVLEKVSL